METDGGCVLDVGIQAFLDDREHGELRAILDQRVRDGALRRMFDKWLGAGIPESGELGYRGGGTPRGGVVSRLPASVYLHGVLDT